MKFVNFQTFDWISGLGIFQIWLFFFLRPNLKNLPSQFCKEKPVATNYSAFIIRITSVLITNSLLPTKCYLVINSPSLFSTGPSLFFTSLYIGNLIRWFVPRKKKIFTQAATTCRIISQGRGFSPLLLTKIL